MSALTHFVGALFSIAGLVLLIVSASIHGNAVHIVTFSIFGATMVFLYTMSTLYHFTCRKSKKAKRVFQILDHASIFLLIAGTYTPVALIALPPGWGWTVFGLTWTFALVGIFIKVFQVPLPPWVSVILYLSMGWLILIACKPLLQTLTGEALFWLVMGGIFYSVGILFYIIDTVVPRTRWFGMHEVFHVFVMLGSFSHFWMLLTYLVHIS